VSITTTKVAKSAKAAHQQVKFSDAVLGEIWREKVKVTVSKMTEPRRVAEKWRWFAQGTAGKVHGRGDRAAMILGPGLKSKDDAIAALAREAGISIDE
jgi:hypothetical protein